MRALNPDQLRTFVEVVELGSFTAAARRLNLSQPAVSLQIRELEARCGVQLLDRLGKKPFPTGAGRQLLVHANRILNEHEEALVAMRRLRESSGQQVRLGMSMTILTYVAREAIRRLKQEHPEIELLMTLTPSTPLADEVRNNALDLAVVSLPIEDNQLIVRVFREENVMALLPEGLLSPLPQVATPELMSRLPFVVQGITDVQTRLAQEWFRKRGHSPHSFVEVQNLEACRAVVAAGLGVTIVPGEMGRHRMEGVVSLPLDPPVLRRLAVIEHKNRVSNHAIDCVRAALLTRHEVAEDQDATDAKPAAARRIGRG
jgi:DNA-binding transcriptional LysR family regulator